MPSVYRASGRRESGRSVVDLGAGVRPGKDFCMNRREGLAVGPRAGTALINRAMTLGAGAGASLRNCGGYEVSQRQ